MCVRASVCVCVCVGVCVCVSFIFARSRNIAPENSCRSDVTCVCVTGGMQV